MQSSFYDTLPAYCISKVVVMESGEIIYEKVFVSPRTPPKISFKDNWMKGLDSEVDGSCKDTQNESNQNPKQLSRTWRPVDGPKSLQSCVPVSVELVDKYEDKDKDVDADQTRTGRPVCGQQSTQLEEIDIDFRVPGLSHAVVKEAENFRVQELVKKIESHPHREALQADLQQNNVYNPFSNNSKAMIHELGNVELSSCAKLDQKCNVPNVLSIGIKELFTALADNSWLKATRRKFNKLRLDALSLSRTT